MLVSCRQPGQRARSWRFYPPVGAPRGAEPSPAAVALGLLLRVWVPSGVTLPCGSGEPEVLTPPRSGHPGEAAAAGVPEGLCLLATSS